MSKHTPAPWKVFEYGAPLNEDGCIATDADGELEIRPAAGQKLGDKAADFRLMAMSPALLDALKTINDTACFATEEDVSARYKALLQIGTIARSMIYRATGEMP